MTWFEIFAGEKANEGLRIQHEGRCISICREGTMQFGAMLALLYDGPSWTWIETWRHGDRNGLRAVRPESHDTGDLRDRAPIARLGIELQRDLAVVSLVGEGSSRSPDARARRTCCTPASSRGLLGSDAAMAPRTFDRPVTEARPGPLDLPHEQGRPCPG